MKKLTEFAIVTSVLCSLCGSTSRLALADTAIWTGAGEDNDVRNPDSWSWPQGATPEGYPDDDTDVVLDHTAVGTTLDFSDNHIESNSVVVGNGTDSVTYNIVSFPDVGHWGISESVGFIVNDEATVNFKNIDVGGGVVLSTGSTLQLEEDGHLSVSWGQHGLLDLSGNLELVLPAEPAGEYVIAEYGRLTGQFASVAGLPPGWRIEYGSGTEDYIRAVPEPSTFALLAIGALGLAAIAQRETVPRWTFVRGWFKER
jgi:hypothetical protein